MKKKGVFWALMFSVAMLLSACAKEDKPDTASIFESTENTAQLEETENKNEVISEDQAYNAVINYCKATNPDFDAEINSEGYTEYWDVSTDENGKIVVLYRSYTAAQIRYYVDPASGETYVTEFVPGITDEEQKTGETFNARNYLNQ